MDTANEIVNFVNFTQIKLRRRGSTPRTAPRPVAQKRPLHRRNPSKYHADIFQTRKLSNIFATVGIKVRMVPVVVKLEFSLFILFVFCFTMVAFGSRV
ncbi:hypothetical protein B9Z19DRAFT_1194041 [Tuber borchii]|uniref:Uncharacterized protein n=1 Tax=Tuber borchii TaxID=42251 RepID=A0A2T6ZPP6_TUBBO|nr:hypothetical protein B9Z19DRAFT_1194041 [Tuber borchii]